MSAIILGPLTVEAGEKKQGFLPIYSSGTSIPITIINGTEDGPALLLTAGVHACEYVGILCAIELANELKPEELKGRIIILPVLNTQAFWIRSPYVVPEDNKNLNRVFPGNAQGTLSEQIAATITTQVLPYIDYHVDLHGGDLHEDLTPYVYYAGVHSEAVASSSRGLAEVIDVPYMVKSFATTGAYNSSALNGIPAILIERGCAGYCKREDVDATKVDVINILSHLNMAEKTTPSRASAPVHVENVIYLNADECGGWKSDIKAGQFVSKGDKLGTMIDLFGNELHNYYAEIDGVVLYTVSAFAISTGDPLVAYGEIAKK